MDDFEQLEVSGSHESIKLSLQASPHDVLHCYDKDHMPITKVGESLHIRTRLNC